LNLPIHEFAQVVGHSVNLLSQSVSVSVEYCAMPQLLSSGSTGWRLQIRWSSAGLPCVKGLVAITITFAHHPWNYHPSFIFKLDFGISINIQGHIGNFSVLLLNLIKQSFEHFSHVQECLCLH